MSDIDLMWYLMCGILLIVGLVVWFIVRPRKRMTITLKRDFVVRNVDTGGEATIFVGTHAVERIPNPVSANGISWIVIRGTKIGMPEDYWRRWDGSHWAHFQVEIKES